ncbi:N-formylglutamate amidohydrolase [Actinoplanes sp. NPDC051411]|uniref:N-formylglutamate amidohydrolase n=1 Tax=Actinoplanes sp. NPDC051411 TaxID=3155522 RepID=UPI003433D7E7
MTLPFEITAGDPASPVVLHVPHASRDLPPSARESLLISPSELEEELDHLTDAHTDEIALLAAAQATSRPWILRHRWSRLAVDPERFPDDREEMRAVGMGAVYTHGYAGRRLRDEDSVRAGTALQTHFGPYAAAVRDLVADRLAVCGRAVIVDVHSYSTRPLPYELHGASPRPAVCLGTDRFHTPADLVLAAKAAFVDVGLDTPFAGCYVPLEFHGREPAVTALMIEIRRDGYMTEPGGPPTAGLPVLAARLAALVNAVA